MSAVGEAEFRVLLALRIRGLADTNLVALRSDLSADVAEVALKSLEATGELSYKAHSPLGPHWALTGAGQSKILVLLSEELDSAGTRVSLTRTYEQFLGANRELLELCTDWQTLPCDDPERSIINDHTDQDYDSSVIARLVAFNERMQATYAEFATQLEHLAGYGLRFSRAVERVQAGDYDWFDRSSIDSYHTVWNEMHYNLQSTLGIDRAAEGVAG